MAPVCEGLGRERALARQEQWVTPVVVGLDAGGTKTAIIIETLGGERLVATSFPSTDWEAEPTADAAAWIAARVGEHLPAGTAVKALGVGAQGLDSPAVTDSLCDSLLARFPVSVAVNDAALLVPAAGLVAGLGVIAGTGSIAVGHTIDGTFVHAGGWGSVLGDDAGAPGIVREATKAALLAHDGGEPDDGLLAALLEGFGVADAERLARAVNDDPTPANWGRAAPAVFAAADAGSALAADVVDRAAGHLAALVDQLVRRGATGDIVVAAGSVIVHQPRLRDAFIGHLARTRPRFSVCVLTEPPAVGAVYLARAALMSAREV